MARPMQHDWFSSDQEVPACVVEDASGRVALSFMQRGPWMFYLLCPEQIDIVLRPFTAAEARAYGKDGLRRGFDGQVGFCVGAMRIFEDDCAIQVASHLRPGALAGWRPYVIGADTRWTSGRATVQLPNEVSGALRRIFALRIHAVRHAQES